MRLNDFPEIDAGFVEFYKRVMTRDGALDRKTKEMLAVAVAYGNGCQPCIEGHLAKARRYGLTDAEYRELVAVAELILAGGARERFVAAEKAAGA
jgi:AhpD family alkylhydroperoxidase